MTPEPRTAAHLRDTPPGAPAPEHTSDADRRSTGPRTAIPEPLTTHLPADAPAARTTPDDDRRTTTPRTAIPEPLTTHLPADTPDAPTARTTPDDDRRTTTPRTAIPEPLTTHLPAGPPTHTTDDDRHAADQRPVIPEPLTAHLPDGPLDVATVRAIDDRLRSYNPPPQAAVPPVVITADGVQLRLHGAGDACVLWIHGGGMFLGAAEYEDAFCSDLATRLGAAVVAVDYRLAPEHPHPAPLHDCRTALAWCASRFPRVVVAGASAGGGLAAALCLLARDEDGPAIAAAHLYYPMLDDRHETPSARENADAPVWNRRLADVAWAAYLGGGRPAADLRHSQAGADAAPTEDLRGRQANTDAAPARIADTHATPAPTADLRGRQANTNAAPAPAHAADTHAAPARAADAYAAPARAADAYAAPARAADLRGLPPTYVDTGVLDLFRDEDAEYARRLAAAGVPTVFELVPGAVHAFDIFDPGAPASVAALERRFEALRRSLREGFRTW